MKFFDELHVRRPTLAIAYLAMLESQPGRPLAFFAPRCVGKMYFLDHDLAPQAKAVGHLKAHADLWRHRTAPLDVINDALEELLDPLFADFLLRRKRI